ncbi:ABC transporter ATP-binding protein/permease [Gammaproteobacteria bacterium]|nr:ABC transporter ATP-binding protein/permease [Gammaproteobacteria bacterium]
MEEKLKRSIKKSNSDKEITNILSLLLQLFEFVDSRRKIQGVVLLVLTFFGSIAEIISLGAVVPFISVLVEPESIFYSDYMSGFINFFNINTPSELQLPLTIVFCIAAVSAGAIRLILLWVSIRLSNATGADLSIDVYRKTLFQPYSIHVQRSSSEIISGITQKVGAATAVLLSLVTVITSFSLLLAILGTLIFIDPLIASLTLLIFGIGYFLIAFNTRKNLKMNSLSIAFEQTNVVKALQEGLGAIRDILLNGTQEIYTDDYRRAIQKLVKARGGNSFINEAPRFGMESLGMILIALLAYSLSFREGGINSALPILGALALGAQRLLPLLQQLYGNYSVVMGSRGSLIDVLSLLNQPLPAYESLPIPDSYIFDHQIEFNGIGFKYPGEDNHVFKDLNFSIEKGQSLGICGTTGSGKSTTIDILMMLLNPNEGQLLVDGKLLGQEKLRSWQLSIAHVPQNIFLSDRSITENIAFGIPFNEIDQDKVIEAAKKSQILEFINQSPKGFQTIVGERGVRLSGGQRQRIALARAFYRNASILVFDEATSALDSETEMNVMNSISGLDSNLTIIIIAHRLTTLKHCKKIIQLEHGKITFSGSYDELDVS